MRHIDTLYCYREEIFENRYKLLVENIKPGHPFLILAQRLLSPSKNCIFIFLNSNKGVWYLSLLCLIKIDMSKYIRDIICDGGEGGIIRQPASTYQSGRSHNLIKIKVYKFPPFSSIALFNCLHEGIWGWRRSCSTKKWQRYLVSNVCFQAECAFVRACVDVRGFACLHVPGREHADAYNCNFETKFFIFSRPNGVSFLVPLSKNSGINSSDIRVGDVITYTFSGFGVTKTPAKPVIMRKRLDLAWEDIIKSVIWVVNIFADK